MTTMKTRPGNIQAFEGAPMEALNINPMKPFHSIFCSEGSHNQCRGSLQPVMVGKCECKCHAAIKRGDQ